MEGKLDPEKMEIIDDKGNFSNLKLRQHWTILINTLNLLNEKMEWLYKEVQTLKENQPKQ